MASYQFGPGSNESLRIDQVARALTTIDFAHHETHDGDGYRISGYTTLGNGGTIDFVVTTPNTTTHAHMYEGVTGITGGTALTPRNNNRNSADSSVLTVKVNPSVTAGTVVVDGYKFGANLSGQNRMGGSGGRTSEIILKQNTSYLWRIVSSSADNIISYIGDWYEHAAS